MRHGGDLGPAIGRYGIAAGEWLDLSTGVNPHAFSGGESNPESGKSINHSLPDPAMLQKLLAVARSAYDVPTDLAICAAPGTEILIRMQPWFVTGAPVLLPTTYRSYREAWESAGMQIEPVSVGDFDTLPATTSIILVNPNNPDGRIIDRDTLLGCARSRRPPARLIVDEAFADADQDHSLVPVLNADDPVIIFRSFGKFYGLPGLRLGFAIGAPSFIEPIAATLGDWPVSASALQTGCAALADTQWQAAMRRRLANEVRELDDVLASAGLKVIGGTLLFRLVRHASAADIHEHLARKGIWLRIFEDAPDLVRIGLPGQPAGMQRLRQGLESLPV